MYKVNLSSIGSKGYVKAAKWCFFPNSWASSDFPLGDNPKLYDVALGILRSANTGLVSEVQMKTIKQLASLALSIMAYEEVADFDVIQFVVEVGCDGDNVGHVMAKN